MKSEWTATIIGWGCCVDLELRGDDEILRGDGWSHRDKGRRIHLKLAGFQSESPELHVSLESGTRTLFEESGRAVEDSRFLRFEFQTPDLSGGKEKAPLVKFDRLTILIRGGRVAELIRDFPNTAFGLSYMPVMRYFLDTLKPGRILEWGPGRSTIMLAEWSEESTILGIEHHPKWHERCLQLQSVFPRTEFVHQPLTLKPAKSGPYVSFPLYREDRYDLIFIDGRLRCDCLAIASQVIADRGVVLLHDAHREIYVPGFQFFEQVRIESNTAILTNHTGALS